MQFSNYSVVDIDDYIGRTLGPKHLGYVWLLPLTVVYVLIFVTGLVGNGFTCVVITRNPYMHTATNYYLFNLAVADMLTLVCAMPLEMYSLWHQYPWQLGEWACTLRSGVSEATSCASILTIVTFSCEQYGAVCRVLRPQVSARQKLIRAFKFIFLIWVVSIAAAAPYGKYTRVNYLKVNRKTLLDESAWCGFPFNDPKKEWEMLMLCSTILFFVVPMVVITGIYVRISLVLYRARNLYEDDAGVPRNEAYRRRIRSRRTVIRMLIAVVFAFFACWAPYHSQRLLFLYVSLYGKWTEPLRKVNETLFSVAGCFFYLNSTINPVLYSVMSNRFRAAFKEEIRAWKCKCQLLCYWKSDAQRSDSFSSPSQPPAPMAEQCVLPMIALGNERAPELKRKKYRPSGLLNMMADFLANRLSAAGVSHVVKAPSPWRRWFWLFIILLTAVAMSTMTYRVLQEYLAYPTIMRSKNQAMKELEFPAVTLCPLNQIPKMFAKEAGLEYMSQMTDALDKLATYK
ncbi:neuromedin-U receptor 2-like [Uloborus diversus]|uniref:neuromedin-U receptor 2-like n=1 Tax=Uloborus diversus TaxID=327109 RepID=UPI002409996E|nr:neuromedin-U receptor 2-like [Uloborus diversus]